MIFFCKICKLDTYNLIAKIRENQGLLPMMNNLNKDNCEIENGLENVVNSILHITQRQLDFFFNKLWKKYSSVSKKFVIIITNKYI